MGLVLEAFGIDLVDRLSAGRPRREPAIGDHHLSPSTGASLPGAWLSLAESPARLASLTADGASLASLAFWSGVAAASRRSRAR
jgi:hypothetical protein